MTKTVNILLHQTSHYRSDLFSCGLKKHGYRPIRDKVYRPGVNDLLVIWNRNKTTEHIAKLYESLGARILVVENGYISGANGEKTFAMSLFHHNGAGITPDGDDSRIKKFDALHNGWRDAGNHILVLSQRSIGEPGVAMPRNWLASTLQRLKKYTNRPVVVRNHPGKNPVIPLLDDLKDAWAAVTWGSGAGIKAIVAGIPVFYEFDKWIGRDGASATWDIEKPYLGSINRMLEKVTWSQWLCEEIESGEAFEWLQ